MARSIGCESSRAEACESSAFFPRSDTVTTCLVLLDLDQIPAPDRSAPQHRGISSDVDFVVLGGRAQYARIFRQISLGQRRHDAAGARAGDIQTDFVANRQRVAD